MPGRHVFGPRFRRDGRIDHHADDDVENVGPREQEAGENRGGIKSQRRQFGDRRIDDQHDRRRDQNPQRAAGADHAGCEALVIIRLGHGRKRQQSHQGHDGADDPAGRREHGAGNQGGDGHGARQVPRRHLQCVKQLVDDVGAFDHVAHEQEQRNGDQRVVFHHRVGVLVQKVEDLVVKDVGEGRDAAGFVIGEIAKTDAHGEQGEGHRKSEQDHHNEKRQHQNRYFGVRHSITCSVSPIRRCVIMRIRLVPWRPRPAVAARCLRFPGRP